MNIRRVIFALVLLIELTRITGFAQESSYSLSISVASDRDSFTNYSVSLTRSGVATPINHLVANRYSLISFNTPKDILWAGCAEGYRMTGATSKTGDHILRDPTLGASITFSNRRNYNLTISCSNGLPVAPSSNGTLKASSSQPKQQDGKWTTFWNAFTAAVHRRDKVALRKMMTPTFNTGYGVPYTGDERATVLRGLNWDNLDNVINAGVGPLRNEGGKIIRQAPPSLHDVGMVAVFQLGKDKLWRWDQFYFYH